MRRSGICNDGSGVVAGRDCAKVQAHSSSWPERQVFAIGHTAAEEWHTDDCRTTLKNENLLAPRTGGLYKCCTEELFCRGLSVPCLSGRRGRATVNTQIRGRLSFP